MRLVGLDVAATSLRQVGKSNDRSKSETKSQSRIIASVACNQLVGLPVEQAYAMYISYLSML